MVEAMLPAANEEFAGMVNRQDSLARLESGWDPHEVWRTRLKRPFADTQERELAPAGEARAAGQTVAGDS